MEILVNNQITELSIIDPKSGCEYTQDLIGNADGFDGYSDDYEMHTMTDSNFCWWAAYIADQGSIEQRLEDLRNNLSDNATEKLEHELADALCNDMEMTQDAQLEVIRLHEADVNGMNEKYRFDQAYGKLYVFDEDSNAYTFACNSQGMTEEETIANYEEMQELLGYVANSDCAEY